MLKDALGILHANAALGLVAGMEATSGDTDLAARRIGAGQLEAPVEAMASELAAYYSVRR